MRPVRGLYWEASEAVHGLYLSAGVTGVASACFIWTAAEMPTQCCPSRIVKGWMGQFSGTRSR